MISFPLYSAIFFQCLTVILFVHGSSPNFDLQTAKRLYDFASATYGEKALPVPQSAPEGAAEKAKLGKDKCIDRINERYKIDAFLYGSHPHPNCDNNNNSCVVDLFVVPKSQEIIVAFRGTNDLKHLVRQAYDLTTLPFVDFHINNSAYGKVTAYYHKALTEMWKSGIEAVINFYRTYKVTFTGHSMGGALAAMASFWFAILCEEGKFDRARKQHIQLHTFGEPRHGNPDYAAAHNKHVPHSVRYVNELDGVAQLPTCYKDDTKKLLTGAKACDPTIKKGFFHQGFEFWFKNGMIDNETKMFKAPVKCLGSTTEAVEDLACSDSIYFIWIGNDTQRTEYIKHHREYFGRWMSYYGIAGCDPEEYDQLMKKVNKVETPCAVNTDSCRQVETDVNSWASWARKTFWS